MTLFGSIIILCGTNNILWNYPTFGMMPPGTQSIGIGIASASGIGIVNGMDYPIQKYITNQFFVLGRIEGEGVVQNKGPHGKARVM